MKNIKLFLRFCNESSKTLDPIIKLQTEHNKKNIFKVIKTYYKKV